MTYSNSRPASNVGLCHQRAVPSMACSMGCRLSRSPLPLLLLAAAPSLRQIPHCGARDLRGMMVANGGGGGGVKIA